MIESKQTVGIAGYGVYVPRYRLKTEELTKAWGVSAAGIRELSVLAPDEDAITMAIEASHNAIVHAGLNPDEIDAVFLGSESKPYSVKPSSLVIAETLGITPKIATFDIESSCKSDVSALNLGVSFIKSGSAKHCLVIGCGVPQCEPSDELEASTSAGAAACILGEKSDSIVYFEGSFTYATETPDMWKRQDDQYIRHGWRYERDIGYTKHITSSVRGLLKKLSLQPTDFNHVVLYQPDLRLPSRVAKTLGFTDDQLATGLISTLIGNTRSGSSLLAISAILDKAQPGEKLLIASYGTGGASEAFSLVVQEKILERRGRAPTFESYVNRKKYVDYLTFLRFNERLKRGG